MKNINKEEKILYLILFSIFSIYNISTLNASSVELYNLIFNSVVFIFMYIPIFLYNLLKIERNMCLSEIIIRYESIDKLTIHKIKTLFFISLRVSIFCIIISNLFFILRDINMIFYKESWIIIILSVITQSTGWFFIGILFLFLTQILKNEILAYIIEICILGFVQIILSPLLFGFLRKFIYPIWDIMYFYDFSINIINKVMCTILIIIINILIIYLYKYLLISKDIGRKSIWI